MPAEAGAVCVGCLVAAVINHASTGVARPRHGAAARGIGSWQDAARTNPAAAAVVGRYHERPGEELYDLRSDPLELRNLAREPAHATQLAALRAEVTAWMKANGDEGRVFGDPRLLSDPRRADPPPKAAKKKQ